MTTKLRGAEGQRDRGRGDMFAKLGRNREYYTRVIGAVGSVIRDVIGSGGLFKLTLEFF